MFLPSVQGYLDQMRHAESTTAWLHATHAVKGVARGVGAFALADAAEFAEQNYNSDQATVAAVLDRLTEELAHVAQFIEMRLKN